MKNTTNIDAFLSKILNQVIDSTNSDAGTLYLKEDNCIKFHLVENRTLQNLMNLNIQNELANITLPLEKEEYVAVKAVMMNNIINIEDVYNSKEFDFSGTKLFDKKLNYKTHSMLAVPISNPNNNEIICVVQLLNKIDSKTNSFTSFTKEDEKFAEALGKISAIAIVQIQSYIEKLIDMNDNLQHLANSLEEKVVQRTKELQILSKTDHLTGLNNRRTFFELGNKIFENDKFNNMFLVITDIDKFKLVNDTYGHQAGDLILREFASIFLKNLLLECVFARIGGEEFAIIYPNYSQEEVQQNLDLIKSEVQKNTITFNQYRISITTSFGFAKKQDNDKNIDEILARADHALYQSKGEGRNKIKFRS